MDDATQPGFPSSRLPGGSPLPCCFRRLSDPLLHSPDEEADSLVQLEDLERDTLPEEAPQPAEAHRPARPLPASPGLPEKDVKKRLEFGNPKAQSGPCPQGDEMDKEEGPRAGRWVRSPTLLNRENLNNNNSKRSCPDDFEVGRWRAGIRDTPLGSPHRYTLLGWQLSPLMASRLVSEDDGTDITHMCHGSPPLVPPLLLTWGPQPVAPSVRCEAWSLPLSSKLFHMSSHLPIFLCHRLV